MGNPVVHWEPWTKSSDKISEFYSKVFDWKIQDVRGMGAFSLFSDPDRRVMGLWKQGA